MDLLMPAILPSAVGTVPSGSLSLFNNLSTGVFAYKNSSQVTQPLAGGAPTQWINAVSTIGLDNTGTNDCAATLQAWLTAGTATRVILYFPAGTYKFASTVTIPSSGYYTWQGDGIFNTIFEASFASGDMFVVNAWYNTFAYIGFTTTITRTSGYGINFGNVSYGVVDNCTFAGMYNGIIQIGSLCAITFCQFSQTVNNNVVFNGTIVNGIMTGCTMNSSPFSNAGIVIQQCGSMIISDCDIIGCTTGLLVNPTSPNGVFSAQLSNVFFDTCTTAANFTGTGNIQRNLFTGCWFGDSTTGFNFSSTAATLPTGTQFTGCTFQANTAVGLLVNGCQDFMLDGCTFGGNAIGVEVSPSTGAVTKMRVIGCDIGAFDGFGGGTNGVLVNTGVFGSIAIEGNNITGNTTNVSIAGTVTGQGQIIIKDNIGGLISGGISTTVAASAGINTTETIVAGGLNNAIIPANSLRVGNVIRITMPGSCTATAAVLSTFTLRMGTAGTTADASIATGTCTGATGTALFKAVMEFVVTSVGATGTILGNLQVANSGVVGIAVLNITNVALTVTATLNTTTANYLSVTYKTAATTDTSTFSAPCYIEVVKT
jgi:hypothetical protein